MRKLLSKPILWDSTQVTVRQAGWEGTCLGIALPIRVDGQPNATNWASGTTSTLAGSSDLLVGAYGCGGNPSVTSTPTDGTTTASGSVATADAGVDLQYGTGWGTTGAAATGTFSSTGSYCTAAVVAVK